MSWAAHSLPERETTEQTKAAQKVRLFRFSPITGQKPPERDAQTQLSLGRMYREGFFQCLRCCQMWHEKKDLCPRCNSDRTKFFPPSQPSEI
jgi:hypothetical protein